MSQLAEVCLVQHLVDAKSIETLAKVGLRQEIVPNEQLRRVYVWALNYFYESGRIKAPSISVLQAEFGDVLDEYEIDIEHEPDESIEWAIDDLKGAYAHQQAQEFLRDTAIALANADTAGKVDSIATAADNLMGIHFMLEDRSSRVDVRDAAERLAAYHARVQNRSLVEGIGFGLHQIDEFTRQVHPGEVAVLAGAPKVGKSLAALLAAYKTHQTGKPGVLFTLENSVEMTMDRLLPMAVPGVPSRDWAHGERLAPEHMALIESQIDRFASDEHPFWILSPDLGQRTIPFMVREAMLRGAEWIIIDQLSFVELPNPNKPLHERIGEAMHTLKAMVSTGRNRVPVMLVNQLSREGVKASRQEGRVRMEHMASAAEIERTADWVFALFQTDQQQMVNRMTFQIVATRRETEKAWELNWDVNVGFIVVAGEKRFDE